MNTPQMPPVPSALSVRLGQDLAQVIAMLREWAQWSGQAQTVLCQLGISVQREYCPDPEPGESYALSDPQIASYLLKSRALVLRDIISGLNRTAEALERLQKTGGEPGC
jgi:hypothetical protein